jgi:hypothetical protein
VNIFTKANYYLKLINNFIKVRHYVGKKNPNKLILFIKNITEHIEVSKNRTIIYKQYNP